MRSSESLRGQVRSLDRRGYPALKDLRGAYDFGDFALAVEHVQGDPFAAPSALSVRVPPGVVRLPRELYDAPHRRRALEDFLARSFARALAKRSFKVGGSGKSGLLATVRTGPEVLERSAMRIEDDGSVVARFEAGLPAHGRSIDGRALEALLLDLVPRCVREALPYGSLRAADVRAAVDLADDQRCIRDELGRRGLVAFVADGSVLPRESGVSSRPLRGAVPFSSPGSLRVTFDLPHRGPTDGMGIPQGVTLIVGGGYHGKTTLLAAVQEGVYDHVAGDGRELVITDATAVKLRAEDGRAVHGVDVSLFIGDLPNGCDTRRFSTADASGSTSQAAGAIEAVEAGARALLVDEDTSATNFMVRDALMAQVVAREHEPITPFVERVRDLYERSGVSSVIVAGSSGAFFSVADVVIQMDCYRAYEISARARAATAEHPEARVERAAGYALPGGERFVGGADDVVAAGDRRHRRIAIPSGGADDAVQAEASERNPREKHGGSRGGGGRGGSRDGGGFGDRKGRGGRDGHGDRLKVRASGLDGLQVGGVSADLRLVEQLVDPGQVATLAACVRVCLEEDLLATCTVQEAVDLLLDRLADGGFDAVAERRRAGCNLVMPRRAELAACLNRLRR